METVFVSGRPQAQTGPKKEGKKMNEDVLIAAKTADAGAQALMAAAQRAGVRAASVTPDRAATAGFQWDSGYQALHHDGVEIAPRGVVLLDDFRNEAAAGEGIAALAHWAHATAQARLFNRGFCLAAGLQGYATHRAAIHGIALPRSLDLGSRDDPDPLGPLLADPAEEKDPATHGPVVERERLHFPKVCIFVVGRDVLAFETLPTSEGEPQDQPLATRPVALDRLPQDLVGGLLDLAGDLRLDFCTFTLKTRAETGELCFAGVDATPDIAVYDSCADGRLADAMIAWLTATPNAMSLAAE